MNILQDLNKLHDKWDIKGGQSGSDNYEDALYFCINELADLIIKHENNNKMIEIEREFLERLRGYVVESWNDCLSKMVFEPNCADIKADLVKIDEILKGE